MIARSITRGDNRVDVRYAVSTRYATSQCTRPIKPKAKNAEWDESTDAWEELQWQDDQCETEEYESL